MARIAKSLPPPEQGYPHREHRSKKGRIENHFITRKRRIRKQKILERIEFDQGFLFKKQKRRKGKWH